jgi:ABC-2 type transport system permease protein
MRALVSAELLRLRTTRSTWLMLAAATALSILRIVLVLRGAGTVEGAGSGSREQRDLLLGSGALAAQLLAMTFGVLLVTSELSARTVTATFLVTPDRRRVVLAKALAAATAGAGIAAALLGIGLFAALLVGGGTGLLDVALLRPLLGTLVMVAGSGVLGVGIGTVVRNHTVAVAVPFVWLVVVETLLTGFQLSALRPWLPGAALAALSGARFSGALPMTAAAAVVTVYALALLLPGTRSLLRRDVV